MCVRTWHFSVVTHVSFTAFHAWGHAVPQILTLLCFRRVTIFLRRAAFCVPYRSRFSHGDLGAASLPMSTVDLRHLVLTFSFVFALACVALRFVGWRNETEIVDRAGKKLRLNSKARTFWTISYPDLSMWTACNQSVLWPHSWMIELAWNNVNQFASWLTYNTVPIYNVTCHTNCLVCYIQTAWYYGCVPSWAWTG